MELVRTRADLVERALRALGQVGEGQNPGADDVSTVDALVDATLLELQEREIVTIADPDEIPNEAFLSLGAILALKAAPEFSVMGQELLDVTAFAQKAEADLLDMTRSRPTYQAQDVDYF